MVDPISMAASVTQLTGMTAPARTSDPASGDFTAWLGHQVKEVNSQIVKADDSVRRLALGEADSLHHVMINLEKAKLSFELVMQVRNKMLDAYQDIMRMQV
jgi:flagellar hook-basal body complex protein FliE